MDDPWGSPWATDDTHPKIDLPALPPQVHTPQTPQKLPSPWGADAEDDAWGGWNVAEGAGGAESPGWGRSPGLRPLRSGTVSRHVPPEPRGRTGTPEAKFGAAEEREERKAAPETVDSAISLGEASFAMKIPETKQEIEHLDVFETVAGDEGTRTEPRLSNSTNDTHETREESPIERVDSPTGEPSRAASAPERPEATRQTSKVQELVHMYDGIAKRKDSPGEPLQAGPRIVLVGSDEVADEPVTKSRPTTDETQLPTTKRTPDQVDEVPARDQPAVTSSDVESLERIEGAPLDVASDDALPAKESEKLGDDKPPIDTSEPIHPLSSKVKAPSAPYSYDLKYLDELFPSTEAPTTDPEPVPDVIIDDTFASISERKAWYRISRRGPMRQHNQGNDDDYVRLDWRSSEVRGRTLKIVRRWMEEDSITGRAVLGRRTGPVGASMFNWDSQAPQVEIGELLRKKSHHRSVSGASKVSKGSLPSPSSATFSWGNDGTTFAGKQSMDELQRNSWISAPPSAASPIAPTFGWSSEPEGTTASRIQSTAAAGPALDRAIPPPISVPSGRSTQSLDSVVANGPATAGLTGQTIPEANEEDEDEWGEMVSSPTWPGEQPSAANTASAALDNVVKVEQDPLPARGPVSVTQTEVPSAEATASLSKEVNRRQITPAASMGEMDPWAAPARNTNTSAGLAPDAADAEKVAATSHPSSLTAEEEAVVHRIIAGLPGLAYMLR